MAAKTSFQSCLLQCFIVPLKHTGCIVECLGNDFAARFVIAPELGFDQHKIAVACHQKIVDRPVFRRQLHAHRYDIAKSGFDLGDRQATGMIMDEGL